MLRTIWCIVTKHAMFGNWELAAACQVMQTYGDSINFIHQLETPTNDAVPAP